MSKFRIKVDHLDMYVRTEIDGGGMDAFWVVDYLADVFDNREHARMMWERLEERFPHRTFTMEPFNG